MVIRDGASGFNYVFLAERRWRLMESDYDGRMSEECKLNFVSIGNMSLIGILAHYLPTKINSYLTLLVLIS